MAWIESHQSLSRHKKTLRTAGRLSVDRHKLIGHLHELWWWALDNVGADGCLSDMTAFEIATAAEWDGDAEAFLDALTEAGFIDQEGDAFYLHDWYDYAGKLIERREAERERSKQRRAARQRTGGNPADAQPATTGRPPDAQQTTVGTVPNLTIPNPTGPDTDMSAEPGDQSPETKASAEGSSATDQRVHDVYEHYCTTWADTWGRKPALTKKRIAHIRSRLRRYNVDELQRVTEAIHASDWHRGVNPNKTVYGTLEFCFRSDEQVQSWLERATARAPTATTTLRASPGSETAAERRLREMGVTA